MKRVWSLICFLLLATTAVLAEPKVPTFPGTLSNARYVYVASYDGDQFDPNLLPEDRQAIADVQSAIQNWGHYILVYRPHDADMIVVVEKRGSEDVLAVYDPHLGPDSTYLWRVMARGGLDKNELPLFAQLRQAVEKAEK